MITVLYSTLYYCTDWNRSLSSGLYWRICTLQYLLHRVSAGYCRYKNIKYLIFQLFVVRFSYLRTRDSMKKLESSCLMFLFRAARDATTNRKINWRRKWFHPTLRSVCDAYLPVQTELSIAIDPSVSLVWGVSARAAMFSRDVTKREVSSLFSAVAVLTAVRYARGPKQLLLSLLPPLHPRGPWTGERGETTPNLSRHSRRRFFLLSVLPPSRFLGDWTAPARACGVSPRSCLLLFTCLLNPFPATGHCPLSLASRFPAHRALLVVRVSLFLLCYGWKCRERRVTIHRRGLIGWNRAISVFAEETVDNMLTWLLSFSERARVLVLKIKPNMFKKD